ncbi:preprotein translocase subunit SecG, partial [Campylobacter jejuni]
ANTIGLGYLYNKASKDSLAEKIKVENNNTTIPSAPIVPTTPNTNSIAPSAPQLPSDVNSSK